MKLYKNFIPVFMKLYSKCPIILQDMAVTIYGLLLYKQRYGRIYHKYLKLYTSRKYSSLKTERKRQNRLFLRILDYAVACSPFYQEFYKDVDLAKIKSVEDIGLLPILTKEILKENLDRVYTIPKKKALRFYTGGTTGTPMLILKRKIDVQKRLAYLDAYKLQYGFLNNKMRSARFFGRNIIAGNPKKPVFWRNNYISKQRYYSTFYLTEENLPYYVKDLNKYKPAAIDGFVSAIYTVAKYMNDHQIPLTFRPKAVFTTAETVLPIHRGMIEKVFLCPVSDQYASNEGAPFIKQCIKGSYHEALDTGVFEHQKTTEGIKLILTSFDSFGMPLIRYDIGDYILESDKECPCGSCHPVIAGIDGRNTNFITTPSRGRISQVNLSVIISELSHEIRNIQFIQETYDLIRIKVVLNGIFLSNEYNKVLTSKMKDCLGRDMNIIIEQADFIEPSKSGKYQMIISKI